MNNNNKGPQSDADKMTDMEVASEMGKLKTKVSQPQAQQRPQAQHGQQVQQVQEALQAQKAQEAQEARQQPQG